MIPEKELEKQELDVWSLQREAWIDDLMCSLKKKKDRKKENENA